MRELETNRLILRKLTEDDAQQIFDCWASDKEVTRYVSWDPHANVEETKKLLAEWINEYKIKDMLRYGIVLKETNTLIGMVDVFEFRNKKPAIGYAFGKQYWGKGYASEALEAMLKELKTLGYTNILVEADKRNVASNKLIKKFGFQQTGTIKRKGTKTYPEEVTVNTYELGPNVISAKSEPKNIIDKINSVQIPRTKNKYVNYCIDNFNKGKMFNHLIAVAIFLLLFGFDWLTKALVYEKYEASWGFIGWRSLFHDNTTIFSAMGIKLPIGLSITMDWFILIGFAVLPHFLTNKKWFYYATAIIASGVLGNGLDRMVFGGVRDIIYTPWMDKGTFNFADIQLVAGALLFMLITCLNLYDDWKKEKEEKMKSIEIIDETNGKFKIATNAKAIDEKEKRAN